MINIRELELKIALTDARITERTIDLKSLKALEKSIPEEEKRYYSLRIEQLNKEIKDLRELKEIFEHRKLELINQV